MKMEVAHQGKVKELKQTDPGLYDILRKLPPPPASMKLSAGQKKWWVWFGVEFVSTNQFTKLDLVHLQNAAFWMDARCQAIAMVREKGYNGGMVQVFNSGASNVSAHVSIIEKATKALDDISAHFGLSIKDRKKLEKTSIAPEGQLDMFEEMKKILHG